ncbi:MAG: MFS transporter [Rhodothermia bacterium]|nr:MAG: MFS transporter [Rhodothermia bacterium]
MDIAMLGPAKPAIQSTFGIDERAGSWILNAFVLANLVGVPVMSKLADLFGRGRVFMTVILLFGAGSLIVALSSSFGMLLVGRSVQGLSVSGIFPIAAAVVGDAYRPEYRGRALGVLGAVFGLAFIVGPVLAGILLQYGWRWIYFGYLPLVGLIWLFALKFIPHSARERTNPVDVRGILFLSGALLSITFGMNQLDPGDLWNSFFSVRAWPAFLLAIILFPAFARQERRAKDPVLRLSMFQNSQILVASLVAIGAGVVEAAFISFPTLASLAMGVSWSTAAFMLIPLSFAIAIGSPLAGRLLDRFGSRAIVVASSAAMVIGMLGIAAWPASRSAFYISTVAIGLGLAGIMGSALNYILMHETQEEERTSSQGLITLFISVGQLFGAALVGSVVASMAGTVAGYSTAFFGIAAMMVVLTLLAFRLKARREEQESVMLSSTDE